MTETLWWREQQAFSPPLSKHLSYPECISSIGTGDNQTNKKSQLTVTHVMGRVRTEASPCRHRNRRWCPLNFDYLRLIRSCFFFNLTHPSEVPTNVVEGRALYHILTKKGKCGSPLKLTGIVYSLSNFYGLYVNVFLFEILF